MTSEAQISEDLAIVGRTSRARPIAIETTLQRIGATATPAPSPVASFAMRYAYATRVARGCAGIAMVACVVALAVFIRFGFTQVDTVVNHLGMMSKVWVATSVLFVGLFVDRVVMSIVMRGRSNRRSDVRWSVGAAIAGAMAFCLYFGMMQVTLGGLELGQMSPNPDLWPDLDIDRLQLQFAMHVLFACALAASAVGAIVVVRARVAAARWMLPVGLVLFAATIIVGVLGDEGPLMNGSSTRTFPSIPLRAVLTATGTVALFLVVTSLVLRAYERDERLSPD